jgi:hypothetical protein
MEPIGSIAKPEAELYKDRKKIYFVRNLYVPHNAADRYREIVSRYWSEVDEHLGRLEAAGKITKMYCESVYMSGEDAMKVLHTMNPLLEKIVEKKIADGAELLPLEDKDIFGAYIDWNNCLIVVRTETVYTVVHDHCKEAVTRRYDYINTVLREGIQDGEAALLVMREEDRDALTLPDDVVVFLVSPPAFDDLQQYIRDRDSEQEFWRT